MPEIKIGNRLIGKNHPPLVIAEIGINHGGSLEKAIQMVDDANNANCECVKFQCHILEDEMIPNNIIPKNAKETIWNIIKKCTLTEKEEVYLKNYVESKNMIYLSTPFSRAAAIRLEKMNVLAYKIGSGECNNYPLIKFIASFKKPIILSTGMNNHQSIQNAVEIFRHFNIPFALMHCTSIYPTPYHLVRLKALNEMQKIYPDAVIGLSDHSLSNYPCLGAVALGASLLERHFTSDKNWLGPDIEISMNPTELKQLIEGSKIIYTSLEGNKNILPEEKGTIDFAYASVVSIKSIKKGEKFNEENIWVKRPGSGQILAKDYEKLLGKIATKDIYTDTQIEWTDFIDS